MKNNFYKRAISAVIALLLAVNIAPGLAAGQEPQADASINAGIDLQSNGESQPGTDPVPLSEGEGDTADEIDTAALITSIIDRYKNDGSDYWYIIASQRYADGTVTDAARNTFTAQAVKSFQEDGSDSAIAMNIIALRALGYNPADITTADGTKIDAPALLKQAASSGTNGDAYRLIAYQQGDYATAEEIQAVIDRLLAAQVAGGWSWASGMDTPDPDSTAAVLEALAPYYSGNEAVQTAVDAALAYLSSLVDTDGNIKSEYGNNPNTTAMAIICLSALGIDIQADERFTYEGLTLKDGLLAFVAEGGFAVTAGETTVNEYATKQAVLALMAADKVQNVFDFSNCAMNALNLKEDTGGGSIGGGGSSDSENTIDVFFSLTGDTIHAEGAHKQYETWIGKYSVEVPDDATAADLIGAALEEKGYSCEGLEDGYITSVTTPDGTELEAGTNGPNSGWMYNVNGEEPDVGISDYLLEKGDYVELYFIDDWTVTLPPELQEDKPSSGSLGGNSSKTEETSKIKASFSLTGDTAHEADAHTEYEIWIETYEIELAEKSTAADLITAALKEKGYTCEGLEDGYITSVTTPDGTALEAGTNGPNSGWMYRVNGEEPEMSIGEYILKDGDYVELYYVDDWSAGSETEPEPQDTILYSDVQESDWFYASVQYVSSNGLFAGYEDGTFLPQEPMTRAMFAAVLSRFAKADTSGLENQFTDIADGSWYAGAVNWAAENNIVAGNEEGRFSPDSEITREQIAAVLYRYAQSIGLDVSVSENPLQQFSDRGAISDWAAEALAWAVQAQILQGTGADTISPSDSATRAQAAAMIERFAQIAA